MIPLAAAASSVLGFVLLALSYDRSIDRQDDAVGARVSTHLVQLLGALSLLACGAASIAQYGWGFGLVAWVGWLALGAFVGIAVLAITAAIRGPLPRISRRRKYRPNAADARDVTQ